MVLCGDMTLLFFRASTALYL